MVTWAPVTQIGRLAVLVLFVFQAVVSAETCSTPPPLPDWITIHLVSRSAATIFNTFSETTETKRGLRAVMGGQN